MLIEIRFVFYRPTVTSPANENFIRLINNLLSYSEDANVPHQFESEMKSATVNSYDFRFGHKVHCQN